MGDSSHPASPPSHRSALRNDLERPDTAGSPVVDSARDAEASTDDVLFPLPSVAEAGVEDDGQSNEEHDELYNIFLVRVWILLPENG